VSWTQQTAGLPAIDAWRSVASSSDGTKLVAVATNDGIYTTFLTPIQNTTVGTEGSISGSQYDAIELQYIGNDTFVVLSYEGNLAVR
jgi:hypothetical protein